MHVIRRKPQRGETIVLVSALLAPLGTVGLGLAGLLPLWPAWLLLIVAGSAVLSAYFIPPEEVRVQHSAATSLSIGCGASAALIAGGALLAPLTTGIGLVLPIAVASALVTYPLWFSLHQTAQRFWATRRRFPAVWECTSCGYDLTGNESGRCPECGRYLNLQQMRLMREHRDL